MSRIIVKNLPNGIKEEKLRNTFSKFGPITDLRLKYTADGVFRKFGFVGYKTTEEAQAALKHFNKSYIDSSKIVVELARNLGDQGEHKPWSKHSTLNKKLKDKSERTELKTEEKKKKGSKRDENAKKNLESQPEFEEFLELNQKKSEKKIWKNDVVDFTEDLEPDQQKLTLTKDTDDTDEVSEGSESGENTETVSAPKSELSDMEYLKSKVKTTSLAKSSSEDDSDSSDGDSSSESDSGTESMDEEQPKKSSKPQQEKTSSDKTKTEVVEKGEFVVKMRGIPFTSKDKDIEEFFYPLKVLAIRVPLDKMGRKQGSAFVEFSSEKDMNEALKRNNDYMGKRYIELTRDEKNLAYPSMHSSDKSWPWEAKEKEIAEGEDISETGRIFVRNLSYSCTDGDLEALFSKYGPLTEVHLPINSFTKKVKGFAFVTFMIPEHAVKAYSELDGSVFQGRMLHLIPAKEKKEEENDDRNTTEGSSYKNKNKSKEKALSQSSHNWNSLFIGTNAVVDAIAEKYQTSKSEVLDPESTDSLAVRVALGETQIVAETKQFLTDSGVCLDSFGQAAAARSKTVILVKNLPAGTEAKDIIETFSKFGGHLGRVLLPPHGVTAIVEFIEPSEAKTAFTKLAYSKFKGLPLYLEWAPVGVFRSKEDDQEKAQKNKEEQPSDSSQLENKQESSMEVDKGDDDDESESEESSEEEDAEESQSTLFVKNINFETTEDTLKEVFTKCGKVKSATISTKRDLKSPGKVLSMGYGFVTYKSVESATNALKRMQHVEVDGHALELKVSQRAVVQKKAAAAAGVDSKSKRKTQKATKQRSTKILVRNVPFQATRNEIKKLFGTFGELQTVRLPKKMSGTGKHRGFAFVDYNTKHDAKRAFKSLCHSTHLYGRRLVLEWADTGADSLEDLRKKTAQHFQHGVAKKSKKTLLDDLENTQDDKGT